jgi:hypothetical protein
VVGLGRPGPGAAAGTATLSDVETLPNADVAHPAGTLGDGWTFVVAEPGAEVHIRVDTRDEHDKAASPLAPTAFVGEATGATLFGAGDDEVPCLREPVCGCACPQIGLLFLPPGADKVVVRELNALTAPDVPCRGGAYVLRVAGPADHVKALTLVKDDKDVSFDPILDKEATTRLLSRATSPEKRDALPHLLCEMAHKAVMDAVVPVFCSTIRG